MAKKTTLLASFLFVVFWIVVDRLSLLRYCGEVAHTFCRQILSDVMFASIIILPVFIFSLLTYFLKEEIFRAWFRFTYLWVLFSFIVIFASTDHSGGLLGISDQEAFGIITWVLYILISLIIIGWKYRVTRLAK